MNNILKNKLAVIGLLISLIAIFFISCSDESYDFPGDSGKVYIRLQSSNMVNSVPNVVNGSISKNILGIFGEPNMKFPVASTMPASENMEVSVGLDNSLVAVYNIEHKTSYKILEANAFIFNNSKVTIKSGQMLSEGLIDIGVNTAVLQNLELGEYLVPISLQSVSGGMSVSQNWNTVYWIISVSAGIEDVPVADRTGWTIKDCSSEEDPANEGAGNGPAATVLDGNNGSYWQTGWSTGDVPPPHHITIDMGKVSELCGIQYVSRNHNMDWPKTMIVEVSVNGESWTQAASYVDLPKGANVEFRSLFDNFVEARYFRLTITEMYGGRPYTALAEVNAFIK